MSLPVFIVGTGRCGSTLLSQALAMHARVLSLSEYFTVLGGPESLTWGTLDGPAFWRRLATPSADLLALLKHTASIPELIGVSGKRAGVPPLLLVPLPLLTQSPEALLHELGSYLRGLAPAEVGVQHERLFLWLQRHLIKHVWVERSGGALGYLEALVKRWPGAKFVHVARRGTECAESMSRHPFFRVKLARVLARNAHLPVEECLAAGLPLDRFGALWSADMLRAERILTRLPSRRLKMIHYEDLLESPERVLRELAQFIDPAGEHAAWAKETSGFVRAPRIRAETSCTALELACRPGMRAYGRMRAAS